VSWYKILLPMRNENSIRLGFRISQALEQQDLLNKQPHGVALLSKPEHHDDGSECWAYYLSPAAASITLPYLRRLTFEPCDRPDLQARGISLLYGSLKASGD